MAVGNASQRGEGGKGRASERSEIAKDGLCMDLRDIFKSRQLSSQIFFQKNCQGNCQVNCATKNVLQGNCQVNSSSKNFVKAIVKSIVLPKKFFKAIVEPIICPTTLSGRLSSQLCYQKILHVNCQVNYLVKNYLFFYVNYCDFQVDFGPIWIVLVNYGQLQVILLDFSQLWLILVNYGQLWSIIGNFT